LQAAGGNWIQTEVDTFGGEVDRRVVGCYHGSGVVRRCQVWSGVVRCSHEWSCGQEWSCG